MSTPPGSPAAPGTDPGFWPRRTVDPLGNRFALEGCDRCACGCKYWEGDRCIDCGSYNLRLRMLN